MDIEFMQYRLDSTKTLNCVIQTSFLALSVTQGCWDGPFYKKALCQYKKHLSRCRDWRHKDQIVNETVLSL